MTERTIINRQQRLVIRAGRRTLSFSTADYTAENAIEYAPYTVKSGISTPANLRRALADLDAGDIGVAKAQRQINADFRFTRADILVDRPVMLVPIDIFSEKEMAVLYDETYRQTPPLSYNVLPELNAVAVFGVSADFRLVLNDHFSDVRFFHVMTAVWTLLHRRSYVGPRAKLYAVFHDHKVEIFSFSHNRFKFCNTFDVENGHDALFFILNVWRQLVLSPRRDELHIAGEAPESQWLIGELRAYLKNAYLINPAAEFNRAPASMIKNMPFDLMTFLTKGV